MAPSTDKSEIEPNKEGYVKLVALEASPREYKLSYTKVYVYSYWHVAGLYGLYLLLTVAQWATIIFTLATYIVGVIGITAGAHRLWSHKTYKAKLPLEILLMVFQSLACQNSALHWARDHRLHHKYSDTDADPHNATRGFFFSHIGWLLVQKHPEVLKKGKTIDLSDLYNNPVLRFQKRYSVALITLFSFVLPTLLPVYGWRETLSVSWHLVLLRIILNSNATFLVNSAAHAFGNKPYDQKITATQSLPLSIITLGECFHNYHHVFPWDYRTAELGNNNGNLTTKFIDFFAWIGWAYDLKTVSDEAIAKRAQRTGDGTNLWGWGDKDLKPQDDWGDKDKVFWGWGDKDLTDNQTNDVKVL